MVSSFPRLGPTCPLSLDSWLGGGDQENRGQSPSTQGFRKCGLGLEQLRPAGEAFRYDLTYAGNVLY